ncbi:Synaptotagmin-like mitochondrial-lipid-binding domain [Fragilaria crotonensis]|nr:Synaptotagmin-like mitochondrial-lipid-binding domain [Fragilaria crotonensis]
MTRETMFAAVGGLILGSVVTAAVTTIRSPSSPSKEGDKETDDEQGGTTETSQGTATVPASPPEINAIEHVNFLADILNRLWPHIAIAGAGEIRDAVEPMFKDTMPGPLSSLHFTKIDLGKVPIVMDNIVVHELKDGTVQFDLDVTWDSDSDIQLKANYVGSFGVKSIKLNGRMTFVLNPLANTLPIVSAIQYGFINPPKLELDFTGLANIADFTIIDKTIRGIMQGVMADMMVLPHRKLYKMNPASDFRTFCQRPIGVARITCVRGRGFRVEKKMMGKHDVPDVYCSVQLGCEPAWKTSTVKDNLSPEWNETCDFLLSDNDQIVSLEAWDQDKGTLDSDDHLGTACLSVADLLLAGKTREVELQQKGKATGAFVTIHCDVLKFATSNVARFDEPKNENQLVGLLAVVVTRASDLPCEKKSAATCVKITYGSQVFMTGVVIDEPGYDPCNPVFDKAFRIPLRAGAPSDTVILMQLMNGEGVLGETVIQHADLSAAPNQTLMERRKVVGDGSIEFSVSLLGVPKPGQEPLIARPVAEPSSSSADPPRETVRISIVSGRGFTVRKRGFLKADVPDIYCQVKFGSSPTVWRTATIKDSITPVWDDESSNYTMTSNNQVIVLEVYDANKRGGDDLLGTARITVGKVLLGGGSIELEVQQNGTGIGAYILVRCEKV